eukprot:9489178-Pyramimonas_sp.AAC.1
MPSRFLAVRMPVKGPQMPKTEKHFPSCFCSRRERGLGYVAPVDLARSRSGCRAASQEARRTRA